MIRRRFCLLGFVVFIWITTGIYAQPGWGWKQKPDKHKLEYEVLPVPKKWDSQAEWERYYQWRRSVAKITGEESRRSGIHKGNRVRTLFYNYGTIGQPATEPSLEWPIGSNHGYGYEFGVMVGAKVVTEAGSQLKIISEGITDGGDVSPDGMAWGWQPLKGYVDPTQDFLPMSTDLDNDGPDGIPGSQDDDGKPDTWPPLKSPDNPFWYAIDDPENEYYPGFYVWPGEYGKGITTADEESYYVMDDYWNKEFNLYDPNADSNSTYTPIPEPTFYYPDENDKKRGGLGVQVECRGYQWANTLAQDCIFFIYEIQNVVQKDINGAYFGMFGDPHVGGANDYSDDDAFYDTKLDMVYAWDHDFCGERTCWRPGYFGYKFLESPGDPYDGKDNDEDGVVDERMDDGIDNDGDWLIYSDLNGNGQWDEGEPLNDDVGMDGISPLDRHYPGPDQGEADGFPTPGEPNFDGTDLDEADQIGLTAFRVYEYGTYNAALDETFYNFIAADVIDSTTFQQNRDNVFLYSSGPITLKPNDIGRFSIALLFGNDRTDLYRSANIVQEIYNAGYRFVKPPDVPSLTAVPGDGKVTLYWDRVAEYSRDPVYGYDFEGYRIYRATDYAFNEVFDITDAQGNPKLWKPIAQFDLDNNISGPHPVESINGIHFYMGDNTGIVHSFTDTTVINGQRYFYAVVSYDSGAAINSIPPSECSKQITFDAYSGEYRLNRNTALVVPQAPSDGYVAPDIDVSDFVQEKDKGTVEISVVDPSRVTDHTYRFIISDWSSDEEDNNGNWKAFSDLDSNGVWDSGEPLNDDLGADGLGPGDDGYPGPDEGEGDGKPTNGEPDFNGRDFEEMFGPATGYSVYDTYIDSFIIKDSQYMNGEDYNPYPHGLKIRVVNKETSPNLDSTGWVDGDCNYDFYVKAYQNSSWSGISNFYVPAPYDYQITVFDSVVDKSYMPGKDMNFLVENLTKDDTADVIYFGKPQIQNGAKVIIAQVMDNKAMGCWEIGFTAPMVNAVQMFEDVNGLWMASVKNGSVSGKGIGLYYLDSGRLRIFDAALGLRNSSVNALTRNWDGQYWCATPTGVSVFNFNNFYNLLDGYLSSTNCRDILLDNNNWLWIATSNGITALNIVPTLVAQDTNRTYFYMDPLNPDGSLISNDVQSLLLDTNNRIWAGTSDGISVFTVTGTQPFVQQSTQDTLLELTVTVSNYSTSDGLADAAITSLYQASTGEIYAGSKKGFSIYDPASGTWTLIDNTTDPFLGTNTINCFHEVEGQVWIGTDKGIKVWDKAAKKISLTEKYNTENKSLTSNNIFSIYRDSNGRVWVANDQGLDYYENGVWNSFNPEPGDRFVFRTVKQLTAADSFTFTASAAHVDTSLAKKNLKKVAVVPNPYVATAIWEPKMDFVVGGQERKIYFTHVPANATIKIFTMNGELVRTLHSGSDLSNGAVAWDLLNEDNLEIAYGIYIFHVDAPGIGKQIGKFAVIK